MSGDTPTGETDKTLLSRSRAIVARLRAEVERLTETVTDGAKAVSAEQKLTDAALAKVERLTGELATLEFPGQHWKDEAFAHEQRADKLEDERDDARRLACEALGPDNGGRESVARAMLWDCYLDGGTPAAAMPSPPASIEIAWSALRVAASRHGSAPVRGVDIDLHEAVEMALTEARPARSHARGATPSMTGPEYVAAVRESGLTPEDVEGIREGVRRHRGVDAFFGTLSGEETEGEFIAQATEDDGATPSDPLDLDDWVADDETMTVSLRGDPGGDPT